MSTAVRATCHNFTNVQSHRFIFSRGKPCVISWLAVSFRIPRSDVYKLWNSSSTLYISEIFLRLKPSSRSLSASIVLSRLEPGILFLLVFRYLVSKKCLKLLFPRLAIVQRKL